MGILQSPQPPPIKSILTALLDEIFTIRKRRCRNCQRASLERAAFFCTQGGFGGKWAPQNMAKVSRQRPIARMIISESQLNTPVAEEKIAQFASKIGMG